jgi:hypothetical protein
VSPAANKTTNFFNPGPPPANSAVPNPDTGGIAYPAGSSTGVAAPVQTDPSTLNAISSQAGIVPSPGTGIAPTQTYPNSLAPVGSPAAQPAQKAF